MSYDYMIMKFTGLVFDWGSDEIYHRKRKSSEGEQLCKGIFVPILVHSRSTRRKRPNPYLFVVVDYQKDLP